MSGFVACLRRSGSSFYKMPRASAMTAVPTSTRFDNLNTYFQSWPKGFSTYMLCEDPPKVASEAVKIKSNKKSVAGGKFTLAKLQRQYLKGQRLAMVTAYDSIMARLAEEGGVDILLVGDSVGNVMLGYDSTVPVTMDEMVLHTRSVTRSAKRALVVGDMPFGSYLTPDAALVNAARLLKEGGCDAVKLEGGRRVAHIVRALTDAGIAVMGHIGLTPQTHAQLGGYRVQGKSTAEALSLLEDADALQRAGAFSMVLECVPTELAEQVTQRLKTPTIGIGAGPRCSGQVLVCADMLGTHPSPPRFVKEYASLGSQIAKAFSDFRADVEQVSFPQPQHSTKMCEETLAELITALQPAKVPMQTAVSDVTASVPGDAALISELRIELAELRSELYATNLRTDIRSGPPGNAQVVAVGDRLKGLLGSAAVLGIAFGVSGGSPSNRSVSMKETDDE